MHSFAHRYLLDLLAFAVAASALAPAVAAVADDRPLPELNAFRIQVRSHMRTDQQLLSQYTYQEERSDIHVSRLGKVATGPVDVYQVYPGNGVLPTYRRLMAVDGTPRSQADLDRDDRTHQRQIEALLRARAGETPSERDKQNQRRDKRRRDDEDAMDDVFRVYDFVMVGRQAVEGRDLIVVDFTPQAHAAPQTDRGKLMTKVKGRVWISEDDYQVARVEAQMLDDLSFGLGLFGKLYKGTTASFERQKVHDEIWLPSEMRIRATGRALVRRFHVDSVVRYSDYRRFSVETESTFAVPAGPVVP
jgi:hypothetical protein